MSMRGKKGKPVVGPDGTVYETRMAAAQALGVSTEAIRYNLLKYGDLSRIGSQKVQTVWRGQVFPSLRACAKAIGIGSSTLHFHLEKYGHLDFAGIGKGGRVVDNKRSKPVQIGPMSWSSRRAVARDLRIARSTLHRCLSDKATLAGRQLLLSRVMAYSAAQGAK